MKVPAIPTGTSMLDAALLWQAEGFGLVPLDGKIPYARLAPQGVKDASTDRDQVTKWWTDAPDANIGVSAGGSGCYFIDLDVPKGDGLSGLDSWDAVKAGHEFPAFPIQMTGSGGAHLFFLAPATELGNTAGKLGVGIDTRGGNGYIVVAPSVHPGTGVRYCLAPGVVEIPVLPQFIVDRVRTRKVKRNAAARVDLPSGSRSFQTLANRRDVHPYAAMIKRNALKAVEDAEDGTRNDTLNAKAFDIFSLLFTDWLGDETEDELGDELDAAARASGLSGSEINGVLISAHDAAEKEPRLFQVLIQVQQEEEDREARRTNAALLATLRSSRDFDDHWRGLIDAWDPEIGGDGEPTGRRVINLGRLTAGLIEYPGVRTSDGQMIWVKEGARLTPRPQSWPGDGARLHRQ